MNKLLCKIEKILLIFALGFTIRFLVNHFFDINVFKDYTDTISLVYYLFMAFFSVFVNDLPDISWSIFDFKTLRDASRENTNKLYCMSTSSGQGGSGSAANPPANTVTGNANPAGNTGPFFRQPQYGGYFHFTVVDPLGSGNNGYLNRQTGRPWHLDQNGNNIPGFSYGPFPRNLAAAMESHATENGHTTRSWSSSHFDANSDRFYREWQEYHHPNRRPYMYNNSAPIRSEFNRLP